LVRCPFCGEYFEERLNLVNVYKDKLKEDEKCITYTACDKCTNNILMLFSETSIAIEITTYPVKPDIGLEERINEKIRALAESLMELQIPEKEDKQDDAER
jgi:hypothetical protein